MARTKQVAKTSTGGRSPVQKALAAAESKVNLCVYTAQYKTQIADNCVQN